MSLPTGTITFLFTDIEGSTARWETHGEAMDAAVARHDRLLRAVMEAHGGHIFKTVGDGFFVAFARVSDAIASSIEAQRALHKEDFAAVDGLRVRMGLHAGEASTREGDYFGSTLNRVARLMSIGHGGQVLLSGVVRELAQERLPEGTSLVDLGLRRLKDLAQPEQVWQLSISGLPDAFPPLNSLDARPNNLPVQVTTLIGREQELEDLKSLVARHRLVTISGSGGVGKTRIALQVGADLIDRFKDGVWFADLAPISDPELVSSVVGKMLGIRAPDGQSLDEAIPRALKEKNLLLILDNCEQVLESAASLADAIHRAAQHVHILATSRQVLGIAGEAAHRLPSLALPGSGSRIEAKSALQFGALAVFVDRAMLANTRFALSDENAPIVADICRRLDGIPLALELAAAKLRVLGLSQLDEKLDERFRLLAQSGRGRLPRQQTLRATIDWSFNLLDERERMLFERLSIFSGGWMLRAATEICSDDAVIDEWAVLDVLSSLVDKSLVIAEPAGDDLRYRMLTSIREYALERRAAQARDAETLAGKHARFYAALVRELQPLVSALEDVQWRDRLAPELDNIRAAIEWTVFRQHDPDVGLSLLAHMEWPELITTPQEALRWFEAAAEIASQRPDALTLSRLLRHCVSLDWLAGRPLAGRERAAARAVEAARTLNDPNEIARALAGLGSCYRSDGRFAEAEAAFTEAFKAPEALNRITSNAVMRQWAVTDLQRGDVERARRRFSELVRLERPGSEAQASALLNLGELEFAAGNVQAAREAARQAKETYARLNSVYLGLSLSNLAAYAIAADDFEDAREHLRQALALQSRAGPSWLGMVIEHHALFAALIGDHERAVVLVGFTDAYYVLRGEARQHTERHGYERLMRVLAQEYAADELASRMSVGANLSAEEALAHASAIHQSTTSVTAEPSRKE